MQLKLKIGLVVTANLLVVAGPTASGKSDLALKLALDLNAEILNIDSVQVYRQSDIGSAKPSVADMNLIKHHLVDCLDPTQELNAENFRNAAVEVLDQLEAKNKQAVLVVGTSLYYKSLIYGLAKLPTGNSQFRSDLEKLETDQAYQELQSLDLERANALHPNDRYRILRALEICKLSGQKASQLEAEHAFKKMYYKGLVLVICWKRQDLYERINQRAERILQLGLIEETRSLLDRYGNDLSILKTLGYAETLRYLNSEINLDQLRVEIAMHTRQFAKRQMTFWRNEPQKMGWRVLPQVAFSEQEIRFVKRVAQQLEFNALGYSYRDLLVAVSQRLKLGFESNEVWYVNGASLLENSLNI